MCRERRVLGVRIGLDCARGTRAAGVRSSAAERGCRVAVQVHAGRSGTGCRCGGRLFASEPGFRASARRSGMSADFRSGDEYIKRIPRGAATTVGTVNELDVGGFPDGSCAAELAARTRLRPPLGSCPSLVIVWLLSCRVGAIWSRVNSNGPTR